MSLLFAYLIFALLISSLCSIAEAVLLSVDRPYIGALSKRRPKIAKWLSAFKAQPDRPLSAILTLNTIAHTVGAAGVGHQAAVVFGESWLGVASAVMTLLILIVSEIIPKTVGANHWRGLAPSVANWTKRLCFLLSPILTLLQKITERFSRGKSQEMSRDEIESLAILGSRSGLLAREQSAILENLFRIEKIRVRAIMTPRSVAFTLPATATVGEYRKRFPKNPFSRIPLVGPDGKMIGFVLRLEILSCQDATRKLEEFVRPLPILSELHTVKSAYLDLLSSRQHMAEVVDEYGEFAGLVTLEDVVETILGAEIVDELDAHVDLRELALKQRTGAFPVPAAAG